MTRVLHLLNQDADFQTRRLAAALAGGLNGDLQSFQAAIGRGGDLRGFWDAASWLSGDRAEVIHAWGNVPLLAAAMFSNAKIFHTPSPLQPSKSRWMHWLWQRRNVQVVLHRAHDTFGAAVSSPPSDFGELSRAVLRGRVREGAAQQNAPPPQPFAGVPGEGEKASLAEQFRFIPPGISISPVRRDQRFRAELGILPDDFVVLAPGESTRTADHHLALWTVAILHELHESWKLLIWGRGELAGEISSMSARLGRRRLVVTAPEREFEDLLPAADAALATAGNSAPMLPAALCMAGGLPLVTTRRWFNDGENAPPACNRSPRALSQKLIEVRNDPALCKSLVNSAQKVAAENWNLQRFLDRHRALYTEAED